MATTSAAVKRNYLPLKKKVEVIETMEKNRGLNQRSLAEMFGCGKTQIANILKKKESIMSLYQSSASGSRVHSSKVCRASEFEDVNAALYKWYVLACSKNMRPSGAELVEKAKQIAAQLGKMNFKGSNGWLAKWKARYDVKKLSDGAEPGVVPLLTVESWRERIPEIVGGFAKEDIWNMDESCVLWKALPETGFGGSSEKGGGAGGAKCTMTVVFFVSAAGVKERPVVILRPEDWRTVRRFDESDMPVTCYHQREGWMSVEIVEAILTRLNTRLSHENRYILLLMDNIGCHPEYLQTKFSNIRVCLLPAVSTPKLQPLELGIIKNFKMYYRKFLLSYVLSKTHGRDKPSLVAGSVGILMAARWVAQAWEEVTEETICEGFRKAGILVFNTDVVPCSVNEVELCEEREMQCLQRLLEDTLPAGERCSVLAYVSAEDRLPVSSNMEDDKWEESFMSQLGQHREEMEDEDNVESGSTSPSPVGISTYRDAILALEDVQAFLERHGHVSVSLSQVGPVVDTIASLQATLENEP